MISTAVAILIVGGFATAGWVYTGRRMRTLSREQHSFEVLRAALFDHNWRQALQNVGPHMGQRQLPDLKDPQNQQLRQDVHFILNYFEYLAAGIRNGALNEILIKDLLRGTILSWYEICSPHIESLRTERRRRATYEHLQWIHERWEEWPPGKMQTVFEWCRGYPMKGRRKRVHP